MTNEFIVHSGEFLVGQYLILGLTLPPFNRLDVSFPQARLSSGASKGDRTQTGKTTCLLHIRHNGAVS